MSLERIVTAGILVFGLTFLFFVLPQQVETVSFGRVFPSTLPTALLWIIIAAAVVQMLNLQEETELDVLVVIRAAGYLALLIASAWVMRHLAFEYVALVLSLSVMLLIGERRWYWLLIGGTAIPLGIWLLVERMLDRTLA